MPNTYQIVNKVYSITTDGTENDPKMAILCTYYLSNGLETLIVPYDMGDDYQAGNTPDATTIENADDDVLGTANA